MELCTELEEILILQDTWMLSTLQFLGFVPISLKSVVGMGTGTHKDSKICNFSGLPRCLTLTWIGITSLIGIAYVATPPEEIKVWIESFGTKGTQFFVLVYFAWDTILITVFVITRSDLMLNSKRLQNLFVSLVQTAQFIVSTSSPSTYCMLSEQSRKATKNRKVLVLITSLVALCFSTMMTATAVRITDLAKTISILDAIQSSVTYTFFFSSLLLEYFLSSYVNLLNCLLDQFDCKKKLQVIPGKKFEESFGKRMLSCYAKIENEVSLFNNLFGLRMTLEILYFSFHTMICAFFTATGDLKVGGMIVLIINLAPAFILGFSVLRLCKTASKVSEKSKIFVQKIVEEMDGTKQTEAYLSVIRISNNPLCVGNSFMDLNCKLLSSVFAAISTYVIVLIQFQLGDSMS